MSVRFGGSEHFPTLKLQPIHDSIINKEQLVLLGPQCVNPLFQKLLQNTHLITQYML